MDQIISGTIIMGSLSGVKIALIMMKMNIVTDNGQRKAEIGSVQMAKGGMTMADREKVIKGLTKCVAAGLKTACPADCPYLLQCFPDVGSATPFVPLMEDSIALLKEQEKKQITLHKKHVITWRHNDEFSVRNLYEAICETLLDDGELFIARTDNHEKVSYVFYVGEGR